MQNKLDYQTYKRLFLNKDKMIEVLMHLLNNTKLSSRSIDIARGLYKYPENWSEFKRYLGYKFKNRI